MGLFSSTKTFIESSSALIMAETPNIVEDTIVNAVLTNRDFAGDIVAGYLNSLHMKGKQIRRYCKNNYVYGLPNGAVSYYKPKDELVRQVLAKYIHPDNFILVNKSTIGKPDPMYFAESYLKANRGFNVTSSVVTSYPFSTQSLTMITPVLVTGAEFKSNSAIEVMYEYSYTTSDRDGIHVRDVQEYETIPVSSNIEIDNIYYFAEYYFVDDKGEIISELKSWYYDMNTGLYPTLNLKQDIVEESQYYPIFPIRENKVTLTDAQFRQTELYKTTKHALNFWGLKPNVLGDAINESPDVNSVDHAYVITGVDITDGTDIVVEYLHGYFKYLKDQSTVTLQDFVYWDSQEQKVPPPINRLVIQDANYKMELYYLYITTKVENGNIGKVGSVNRNIYTRSRISRSDNSIGSKEGDLYYSYDPSSIVLRKQISPTQIEIVEAVGIMHMNYVYSNAIVETTLRDALKEDKNNFIIPVNVDIANNMSLLKANSLMYYAIRIVYNSKIKKKLKWYQSGFFQAAVIIAAFAIAVVGGIQFSAQIVAAYGSGGAAAVALVVVQSVLISVAVDIAVDFLIDTLGLEASIVAALIATAASFAVGDSAKITSIGGFKLPTALDMRAITSAFTSAVQSATQDANKEIVDEIYSFNKESEELLEELNSELNIDKSIDPYSLDLITTSMSPYETAEEFLNRLIYTEDTGALSLEVPSYFVENMLKLEIPDNDIRTQLT